MQFSDDGKMLVSVGIDQEHSIALWESPTGTWTDGRLLASCKGDAEPVLFCSFYGASNDMHFLASGGRFHQKFWKLDGRCLNSSYPECEESLKFGTLLCGTAALNKFMSGSSSGHIYVWEGRKMLRMIRAHGVGVTAIWADKAAGVLTSAKDGIIKQWTIEMKHLRSFSLVAADVPPILPCIRSLDAVLLYESVKGRPGDVTVSIKRILASTSSGEIYEVAGKSGGITLVHESHYSGELWGLCANPSDPDVFATCGDDRTVRVWSIASRRLMKKAVLDCTARSISWSQDGRNILVGLGGSADNKRQKKDGAWLLLNAETLKPIFEGRSVHNSLSFRASALSSLVISTGPGTKTETLATACRT
jgi:microtubule-associated protein-like 6